MTYHTRMFLRLVPGALLVALVVYLWIWMFEVLGMILIQLGG